VRSADAKVREIFLDPKSTSADRGISIGVFRVARRKALMASVDVLFELKALVSKKEWNAIWPKGYFDLVPPPPLLAEKVPSAIPAVVSDPARQKQATDVAAALVKAAKSNAALRDKARSRLEKNLAEYGAPRDEFIDSLNDLEERQTKAEDALVDDAGQLREILTPDEWRALVSRLTGVPPPAPKQAKAPGSDRDEHGCIGSAGYSWCAREKACVRPWELAKEKGLGSGEEAFRAYCSAPPPR